MTTEYIFILKRKAHSSILKQMSKKGKVANMRADNYILKNTLI